MPTRERTALLGAAAVLVVVLPAAERLASGLALPDQQFHPQPLRQVPGLRHPRARHRPDLGLYGRALARTRGLLRAGRLCHGHAPDARDRHPERLQERPARLHGVEPGQGAAALLAAVLQRAVHAPRSVRGSRRGGLRLRLPHVPEPHPRRVLLDHHPGARALRLAPVQPQLAEPRAAPMACRGSRPSSASR